MARTQIESGVSRPRIPDDKKRVQPGYTVPKSLADAVEALGIEMGGIPAITLNERALRWFLQDVANGSPRAKVDPEDQWSEKP